MTDNKAIQEAIDYRKRYAVRHRCVLPRVHIPPTGAINEIITVDFSDISIGPVVTRNPPMTMG